HRACFSFSSPSFVRDPESCLQPVFVLSLIRLHLCTTLFPYTTLFRSLTARLTSRAGTKVGLSDPVVPHGRAIAQRIKATPGITGLSPPRVHIDGEVWYLDVGSSHPGAVVGPKGWAVRPLKRY